MKSIKAHLELMLAKLTYPKPKVSTSYPNADGLLETQKLDFEILPVGFISIGGGLLERFSGREGSLHDRKQR